MHFLKNKRGERLIKNYHVDKKIFYCPISRGNYYCFFLVKILACFLCFCAAFHRNFCAPHYRNFCEKQRKSRGNKLISCLHLNICWCISYFIFSHQVKSVNFSIYVLTLYISSHIDSNL